MAKKKPTKKFEISRIGGIIDNIAKKTPIIVEKEDKNIDYISTGIYVLNACISGSLFGGIKGDAISVFAGPESSGKTYLALNICREAQKKGYIIVYIDTENTIHRQNVSNYGLDASPELFHLVKTNKVEEINIFLTQMLEELKTAKLNGEEIPKMLFTIDSLAQMASTKEKEDLISGKLKQDMTKAKAIGSLFRSITMDLGYLDIPMLVNNQSYLTMDLFPQEVMKGGKSLYYSASNITFLSKAKLKTGEEDEYDIQAGIIVTAKGVKNRQVKPKKVKFEINFESGCNPYKGLEWFCRPELFDKIGIAKGKFEKFKEPKEIVNEITGEVTIKEGEFTSTGNRWYIKHLDKYVFTKGLFTPEIFTPEVLQKIEPFVNSYFAYKTKAEQDEALKGFEDSKENDDFKEIGGIEDMGADELFN